MSSTNRIGKFTERARKVLNLAQEEAQRFKHNYIGTEHLLLGLIREEGGIAGRTLHAMGFTLESVRSEIEAIIKSGDHIVLGEIGLTPGAKRTVELAVDEARRLHHHYIGTEHLLLGLVREGQGISAQILAKQGATLEEVRTRVMQMLSQSSTNSPTSTASEETKQSDE